MSKETEIAKSRQSNAKQRVFGIPLGINPKILVLLLLMLAAGVYWWNSRSDDTDIPTTSARAQQGVTPTAAVPAASAPAEPRTLSPRRRERGRSDSGTLRLRTIDGTRGDVDPMLRLDLLERLQNVKASPSSRNIFEAGAISAAMTGPSPVRTIMPGPKPIAASNPLQYPPIVRPVANIPFRYYGFVKPYSQGEANRGFFLQGDDVLVAAEGQLVLKRYLIVQLTASTAKVEDTEMQLSQTLNVLPEAVEQ